MPADRYADKPLEAESACVSLLALRVRGGKADVLGAEGLFVFGDVGKARRLASMGEFDSGVRGRERSPPLVAPSITKASDDDVGVSSGRKDGFKVDDLTTRGVARPDICVFDMPMFSVSRLSDDIGRALRSRLLRAVPAVSGMRTMASVFFVVLALNGVADREGRGVIQGDVSPVFAETNGRKSSEVYSAFVPGRYVSLDKFEPLRSGRVMLPRRGVAGECALLSLNGRAWSESSEAR